MAAEPTVQFGINLPASLGREIERVARTENITPDALVQEALERMLRQRRLQRHYNYGEERARTTGLTDQDVPRLIDEVRRDGGSRSRR